MGARARGDATTGDDDYDEPSPSPEIVVFLYRTGVSATRRDATAGDDTMSGLRVRRGLVWRPPCLFDVNDRGGVFFLCDRGRGGKLIVVFLNGGVSDATRRRAMTIGGKLIVVFRLAMTMPMNGLRVRKGLVCRP